MFIDQYFNESDGLVSFTQQQGSDFAKGVAGDFNLLHDVGAKRFCIPGDLLFAVVLARYGVSQHMEVVFSGMVGEGVELLMPAPAQEMLLRDSEGRDYLQVTRSGEASDAENLIQNLTRAYVEFSGHSFPDLLQPLMAEKKVMINPTRPMVMYQSMGLDLDTLDIESPRLHANHSEFQVDGKRGAITLGFNVEEGGQVIGRGRKHILVSGLREYDAQAMQLAIDDYTTRKQAYLAG